MHNDIAPILEEFKYILTLISNHEHKDYHINRAIELLDQIEGCLITPKDIRTPPKYEYAILEINWRENIYRFDKENETTNWIENVGDQLVLINSYGKQGWELCATTLKAKTDRFETHFFKRKLKER